GAPAPMTFDAGAAAKTVGPPAVDGIGPAADWQGYWRAIEAGKGSAAGWVNGSHPPPLPPPPAGGGWGGGVPPRPRPPPRGSFVERHGLWNAAQADAAVRVEQAIGRHKLELVRFSFPDQHGVLRGKTLLAGEAARAMRSGVSMTSTLLAKDTSHFTVFPVFE